MTGFMLLGLLTYGVGIMGAILLFIWLWGDNE
jgi:hypothetical protein